MQVRETASAEAVGGVWSDAHRLGSMPVQPDGVLCTSGEVAGDAVRDGGSRL